MSALNLTVQLPRFEGPLALLLYLIRKDEMNIFDIEIHKITAQYLDYIRLMKEFDLELAGDFVAMAATLIQIKSKMLLPHYNEEGEIVEDADPRKELVQRLLEYQKFQEAAKLLYDRPLLGRDVWARGVRERFDEGVEEIEIEDNALYALIGAYRRSLRAAQKRLHRVTAKAQSIASRILEMKDRLLLGVRVGLSELLTGAESQRRQLLITFLSALELAKLGFVRLFQVDVGHEVYLECVKPIEASAISSVEEYESLFKEQSDGDAGAGDDRALATEALTAEPTVEAMTEGALDALSEATTTEVATNAAVDSATEGTPVMALGDDFELKDEDDLIVAGNEEIATDEEILAAELELAHHEGEPIEQA